MKRQSSSRYGMLRKDREHRKSRLYDLVEELDLDVKLPRRHFDLDLPKRRGAHGDVVFRLLNRMAGRGIETLGVVQSPQQRMAIEEKPQSSSSP